MMPKNNFMFAQILIFSLLALAFTSNQAFAEQNSQAANLESDKDAELKPQIGSIDDPIGVDPETFEFSSAEKEIWLDDHLKNVNKPARLYYEFVRNGTYDEGFTDAVYLDIIKINKDGSKNALLEFFTGERQQKVAPDNLNDIRGNPVIGIYMQGDVMEMNRLTKGNWRYFQRSIKFAIADSAKIEAVSFNYKGKTVAGEKITITPYVKDPRRNQFTDFADKRYEFIFSRKIPGSLYQISTVVPAKAGSDKEPLIRETLTLQNVEYRS